MDDFEELPKMAGWHETKFAVPEGQLAVANFKQNYNITFHRVVEGRNADVVGKFDFNGPQLVFEGDAEESAKVFVDWVGTSFKSRLIEEYKRGFEDAQQGKEYKP